MGAAAPQSLPAHDEPQFAITLFSSVSGNDSCGVDTDAKYNDTDLCWGPLRRVDVYRIYLVSVLSWAGAHETSVRGAVDVQTPFFPGSALCPEKSPALRHSLAQE